MVSVRKIVIFFSKVSEVFLPNVFPSTPRNKFRQYQPVNSRKIYKLIFFSNRSKLPKIFICIRRKLSWQLSKSEKSMFSWKIFFPEILSRIFFSTTLTWKYSLKVRKHQKNVFKSEILFKLFHCIQKFSFDWRTPAENFPMNVWKLLYQIAKFQKKTITTLLWILKKQF